MDRFDHPRLVRDPQLRRVLPSNVRGTRLSQAVRTFRREGTIRIAAFSRPGRWEGLDILVDTLGIVKAERPDADFRLDLYGNGLVGDDYYLAGLRRSLEQAP